MLKIFLCDISTVVFLLFANAKRLFLIISSKPIYAFIEDNSINVISGAAPVVLGSLPPSLALALSFLHPYKCVPRH